MSFDLGDFEQSVEQQRRGKEPLAVLLDPDLLSGLTPEQVQDFAARYHKLAARYLHSDTGGDDDAFRRLSEATEAVTDKSVETAVDVRTYSDELEDEIQELRRQVKVAGANVLSVVGKIEKIRADQGEISIFEKDAEILMIDSTLTGGVLWVLDGYGGVKEIRELECEDELGEHIVKLPVEESDAYNVHPSYEYDEKEGCWYYVQKIDKDFKGTREVRAKFEVKKTFPGDQLRILGSAKKTSHSTPVSTTEFAQLSSKRGETTALKDDFVDERILTEVALDPSIPAVDMDRDIYFFKNNELKKKSATSVFVAKPNQQ